MIRSINTNFLKNSKLKLCMMGMVGVILSTSLVGCTTTRSNNESSQPTLTQDAEEILIDETTATVNLDYLGLENLPERDIITFTNLDSKKISAIASTDNEKRYINISPGNYAVTSNYLETTQFEITDSQEEWTVEANYNSQEFKITEVTNKKATTK